LVSSGYPEAGGTPIAPAEVKPLTPDEPVGKPGDPTWVPEKLRQHRLAYAPAEDVELVLKEAERFVDEQRGRQARLDAKATSLLGAIGLSLTVAFTYGGMIVHGSSQGSSSGGGVYYGNVHGAVWVAFGCAILAGLVTAGFALWSLKVSDNPQGVANANIFPELWIRQYDAGIDPEKRKTAYRQKLALHFWEIGERNRAVLDRKAGTIFWGQVAFGVFLVALLAVFLLLVFKVATG
jgi:hypothetical protein